MILGITGGVASGKSTLAGILAELGAPHGVVCVSADQIARELLAPGSDLTLTVLEHYGPQIALAGEPHTIDRHNLARRIFADAADRKWLEALLHPVILARMSAIAKPHKGGAVVSSDSATYNLAVAEIPLLYEAHVEDSVDLVAVTSCSEATQLRRLMARRPGLLESEALQQIRSQMPLSHKAARADFVIGAEGIVDDLRVAAAKLFYRLVYEQV